MYQSLQPESKSATTKRAANKDSNEGVSIPSRTIVYAKLEMTSPQDTEEVEADAIAKAIVSEGKIMRNISQGSSASSGIAVSSKMESQLYSLEGSGHQMPSGLRNMMESGFGRDFSRVRLHTDSIAADMSSSIHAKAFTIGNDIYFNHGQYSPNSSEGQHLIAHELTHVVQGTGKVGREPQTVESNESEEEHAQKSDNLSELTDLLLSLKLTSTINNIYNTFQNIKSFKGIYKFVTLFKELGSFADKELGIIRSEAGAFQAGVKANPATKMSHITGWLGVAITLQDYYTTLKSLDFEQNSIASSSVIILKTGNLASTIMTQPSIFPKLAAASPQTAAIMFAFGSGFAVGDIINAGSEKIFGKTPGAAIVDFFTDLFDDSNELSKDDVINYINYATSKVAYEVYNEYDKLTPHQKEYVSIITPSNLTKNPRLSNFMKNYRLHLINKTERRFLYKSFALQMGNTTKYRLSNIDLFILKNAFRKLGLY